MELDHNKSGSGKGSERIRSKRLRTTTSFSAVTAALRDDESEIDMDGDDTIEEEVSENNMNFVRFLVVNIMLDVILYLQAEGFDPENPQWQLFEAVRVVSNSNGTLLSEPFWRLPSRRFYPDYYREIKNPVSLTQIKKKLLDSAYGTVSEVAGDLNIMFENAKKYNVPTSKLYKVS